MSIKSNETATISTLFGGLTVWPIVMLLRGYKKIMTTSVFDIQKQNLAVSISYQKL